MMRSRRQKRLQYGVGVGVNVGVGQCTVYQYSMVAPHSPRLRGPVPGIALVEEPPGIRAPASADAHDVETRRDRPRLPRTMCRRGRRGYEASAGYGSWGRIGVNSESWSGG